MRLTKITLKSKIIIEGEIQHRNHKTQIPYLEIKYRRPYKIVSKKGEVHRGEEIIMARVYLSTIESEKPIKDIYLEDFLSNDHNRLKAPVKPDRLIENYINNSKS